MSAFILINGLTPPITNFTVGATITLTNQSNAGITTWAWALLDKPPGSAAFLGTPTLSSTPVTLDLEGTYLFQLVVNGLVLAPATAIAAVPTLLSGLRLPAAGEQREADTSRGWTTSVNANMTSIEDMIYTGHVMTCMTAGAYNHGQAVYVSGETTLSNGLNVPTVTTTNGLALTADRTYGVLTQTTAGAALATVRLSGEITEFTVNTAGRTVGDTVYLSDTNNNALNSGFSYISGTHTIVLGYVTTVGASGRIAVQISTSPGVISQFNVKKYGAVGDGITDDTAAINAAMHTLQAQQMTITTGSVSAYCRPTLYFPAGVYQISDVLDFTYMFDAIGDSAIIRGTDSTKNLIKILPSGQAKYTIKGLTLVGGKDQIFYDSGTVNNTFIRLTSMMFFNPAQSCVHAGPTHSGLMICEDSFAFTNDTTANVAFLEGGDDNIFARMYCAVGPGTMVHVNGQIGAHFEEVVGTGNSAGGPWFNIQGAGPQVNLRRVRMGGEATFVDVQWRAVGGSLVLKECSCYSSGLNNFEFYDAPDYVSIDLQDGGGNGLWFDPSMSSARKQHLGQIPFSYTFLDKVGNPGGSFPVTASTITSDMVGLLQATKDGQSGSQGRLAQVGDLLFNIDPTFTGYGEDDSANHCTGVTSTNAFGGINATVTATLGGANSSLDWSTALYGAPQGTYTLVADCETTAPVDLQLVAGAPQSQRSFILCPGDPSPRMIFNMATGFDTHISVSCGNMLNGSSFTVNRIRIFKGRQLVQDQRTILWGATAPTVGSYQASDEFWYPQPSPGGFRGQVCTTGGIARSGAWAQNTVYVWGQQVSNLGNVYRCVGPGTSLNSGTGPNSTSGIVTDNTCSWLYMGADVAPVWKTFGAISA